MRSEATLLLAVASCPSRSWSWFTLALRSAPAWIRAVPALCTAGRLIQMGLVGAVPAMTVDRSSRDLVLTFSFDRATLTRWLFLDCAMTDSFLVRAYVPAAARPSRRRGALSFPRPRDRNEI